MAPSRDSTPAPTSQALRAELERTRSELVLHASALRQEVALRTNWRVWVRRHPYLSVSLAFVVGLVLGDRLQASRPPDR